MTKPHFRTNVLPINDTKQKSALHQQTKHSSPATVKNLSNVIHMYTTYPISHVEVNEGLEFDIHRCLRDRKRLNLLFFTQVVKQIYDVA